MLDTLSLAAEYSNIALYDLQRLRSLTAIFAWTASVNLCLAGRPIVVFLLVPCRRLPLQLDFAEIAREKGHNLLVLALNRNCMF